MEMTMENLFKAMYDPGLAASLDRSAHLHSGECTVESHRQLTLFLRYLEVWPHHCQACQCEGGHSVGGSYTYNEPPDFEPCDECIEEDLCPRCGEPSFGDKDIPPEEKCCLCGWDPVKPEIAPPMHLECWGDCLLENEGWS